MDLKVKVKSLSRVRLLATPWSAAYQAPLSMGFSRQEYWSELLESVIQSEVSQKEKDKYRILMHVCRIKKNGTNEPSSRAGTEVQTQRTDTWAQQGKGRVG